VAQDGGAIKGLALRKLAIELLIYIFLIINLKIRSN
jgi:hypothetical protein